MIAMTYKRRHTTHDVWFLFVLLRKLGIVSIKFDRWPR
jgi:hypothetical protein